jgi:Mrp family chromosome partitioning ATPase
MGLDTTVGDGGAAELQLGAPVAGTLPVARTGMNAAEFPEMFARENQRHLARLYQLVRGNGSAGNIILLAGSGPKEGGSLVGYALAQFLTRYAHEKTVFVDCTRHPLVRPEASDSDASIPTVLPWPRDVETTSPDASDIRSTLTKLRQEFTYVVVAAGAVKDTTDLFPISELASSTFLIVDAGKTRRAAARHSLEQLRRYGFEGIQLILNRRVFYIPRWIMRFV